jgi:alcohol dehydrogenase, propanol-preferring
VPLDRAVTFAPSGKFVVSTLGSLRKGGVVAINAIYLDQMLAFDYGKAASGREADSQCGQYDPTGCAQLLKISQQSIYTAESLCISAKKRTRPYCR